MRAQSTAFILVWVCVSYCIFLCTFRINDSDPTLAPPRVRASPPSPGHGELPPGPWCKAEQSRLPWSGTSVNGCGRSRIAGSRRKRLEGTL